MDLYFYQNETQDIGYDANFWINDGRIGLRYGVGIDDHKVFPGDNYCSLAILLKDGIVSEIAIHYEYE